MLCAFVEPQRLPLARCVMADPRSSLAYDSNKKVATPKPKPPTIPLRGEKRQDRQVGQRRKSRPTKSLQLGRRVDQRRKSRSTLQFSSLGLRNMIAPEPNLRLRRCIRHRPTRQRYRQALLNHFWLACPHRLHFRRRLQPTYLVVLLRIPFRLRRSSHHCRKGLLHNLAGPLPQVGAPPPR